MYTSTAFSATLLLSLALAANHDPVTINNLDSDFNVKCGRTTVAGRDIYNAVAWGMSLNDNGETFTGNNGKEYPSYYGNSDEFKWISSKCNVDKQDARQHMPVIKGGYFGETSTDQGSIRAVYWYNFDTDVDGHGLSYYCGTIYHIGTQNAYAGCDVTNR